jgi:hypothetical protein
MRWAEHVARVGKGSGVYRTIFFMKPEGKRWLGISRLRWEGDIRIVLTVMGWKDVDYFNLVQDW